MLEPTVQHVEISKIERDDELQVRAALYHSVVQEYAAQLRCGARFPPVLVFHDSGKYWLADGYHRTAAHELLAQSSVWAEVRQGTRDDAVWASIAANQTHGLRRSNADKRRSVERALLHPRAQRLSDRQIASHCGVHHYTVGRIREELERNRSINVVVNREVVRAGSRYAQKIHGIRTSNRDRQNTVVERSRLPLATLGSATSANVPHSFPRPAGQEEGVSDDRRSHADARSQAIADGTHPDVSEDAARVQLVRTASGSNRLFGGDVKRALRLFSDACAGLAEADRVMKAASESELLLRPTAERVGEFVRELENIREQLGETFDHTDVLKIAFVRAGDELDDERDALSEMDAAVDDEEVTLQAFGECLTQLVSLGPRRGGS